MKKFIIGSAAAALASAQVVFAPPRIQALLDNSFLAAPKVNILENFVADLHFYTYNATTQELSPYMNMTATEYVQASANRERLDVWMDIPNVGYGQILEVFDFDAGILTMYIPSIEYCAKYQLPIQFDLEKIMRELKEQDSDLLSYLGEETLAWNGQKVLAYKVNAGVVNPMLQN